MESCVCRRTFCEGIVKRLLAEFKGLLPEKSAFWDIRLFTTKFSDFLLYHFFKNSGATVELRGDCDNSFTVINGDLCQTELLNYPSIGGEVGANFGNAVLAARGG
jgi:hypothetical protein